MNEELLRHIYTVESLAERLGVEEIDVWTRIKMYTVIPPVWVSTDTPVWSHDRIERWIAGGMKPVAGMIEHRREVNKLIRESLRVPERDPYEQDTPIVALHLQEKQEA